MRQLKIESEESTMTKRQKRILIAKAIKFAIIFIGVIGLMLTMSSFEVLEDSINPIVLGIAEYLTGLFMMGFSLYACHRLYS